MCVWMGVGVCMCAWVCGERKEREKGGRDYKRSIFEASQRFFKKHTSGFFSLFYKALTMSSGFKLTNDGWFGCSKATNIFLLRMLSGRLRMASVLEFRRIDKV